MHTPRSGAALGAVAMLVVVWRWTGGLGRVGGGRRPCLLLGRGVGAHHTGDEPM